jgi:hypothetical protein
MRVLISTGMPSFIAFLWTCWMFFGGVIALAEGAFNWFASREQLQSLGRGNSKGASKISGDHRPFESTPEPDSLTLADQADGASERSTQNLHGKPEARSESWQADRQRGMAG